MDHPLDSAEHHCPDSHFRLGDILDMAVDWPRRADHLGHLLVEGLPESDVPAADHWSYGGEAGWQWLTSPALTDFPARDPRRENLPGEVFVPQAWPSIVCV
jgi:hypothetical protein